MRLVLVANPSDSEHHIQAGTALGTCEEVELVRETADNGLKARAASSDVAEHFQVLERSSECLNQRQAAQLRILFISLLICSQWDTETQGGQT